MKCPQEIIDYFYVPWMEGELWIMFSIICFLLISAHGISASVCAHLFIFLFNIV